MSFNGLFFFRTEPGHLLFSVFYAWSPILVSWFLLKGIIQFHEVQNKLIIVFIIVIVSVILNFRDELSISSVLHLSFFLLIGFILINLMDDKPKNLLKIGKIIILLYFFNVIIAFFFVTIGADRLLPEFILRVINKSSEPFGFSIFRIVEEKGFKFADNDAYRYMGWAIEPSYSALYLTGCMLSIIYFSPKLQKKLLIYLGLYSITIIIMRTSYGILGIGFSYLYFLQKNIFYKIKNWKIKLIIVAPIFALFIFLLRENTYMIRFKSLGLAMLENSSSIDDMYTSVGAAESSAFFRIMPPILYFSQINLFSLKTWIGYGPSNKGLDLFNGVIFSTVPFFPGVFHSFGLLGGGYFLYFILSSIKELPFIFILFVFICLTNSNYSTQLFWFLVLQIIWVAKCSKKAIKSIKT
jgi:hypothetical protein